MSASPKPAKGTAKRAKTQRRRAITNAERRAKLEAKERDGWRCRRCGVTFRERFIAAAHIKGKGMGGDAGLRSSRRADYVSLCEPNGCHQGPRSVHSGHVEIVPLTDRGGDGPVDFKDKAPG